VVALCGRARRGWSCLAGPRRRRPSSASDAPGRPTLPQAPLATAMDGVANPAVCQLPPTSRFRGRASRRPRPPPRQCLRPAPEWKLRGAGPGFRPTSLRCCPSTTPPGMSGTPETGSRVGFCLLAWSPPLARPLISPGPPGFPIQHRVSSAYASRHRPGPPPVRRFAPSGSPVSALLPGRAPL
jgi:hypothetical protein